MTILARVISGQRPISLWLSIFIFLYSVFNPIPAFAGFDELLNPPVTFGDLLDTLPVSSQSQELEIDQSLNTQKTERFKKLLAELEENYAQSLSQFRAKTENIITNNQQLTTNNSQLISPSPFIPIPTLLESVSQLANIDPATHNLSRPSGIRDAVITHPSQTASGQPTTIYPTPTLTDQLLLASIDNQSRPSGIRDAVITHPSQTASGQLTTNNILGSMSQNTTKSAFTIALLGDSMTDTLGKNLPHLASFLKSTYPEYTFSLLNYGQGATDMDSGLYRLTSATEYMGTSFPPLLSYKPDILVVESFAYNHWSGEKYDLDRQWLTIAKIIDTVRANSPNTKIILAATIAPNQEILGDGILNWNASLKEQSSLITKAYLQNMVNFATSEKYPLADAYHPSLGGNGQGQVKYINSTDHLHPSNDGAYLYSLKIVEAIKNNALIQ